MLAYTQEVSQVLNSMMIDAGRGLDQEEALNRKEKYGENCLQIEKGSSFFRKFCSQFYNMMIIILLIAAIISFIMAMVQREMVDFFEPLLIILIVFLNALIGVIQEDKAEKALAALKNMSAPHARVIRNGEEIVVQASELVPGDLIKLEAGDMVPADARLIKSTNLQSIESALTGESEAVLKDANQVLEENTVLGNRINMVFSGCIITYGVASAVVTQIGMNTEMGKIATLLNREENKKTPLQEKLEELGKYLGIMALIACLIIFVIGIFSGIPIMEIFMTAVSLAVSAIPEGLPAVITIVLALGVQEMAKHNAIIKNLSAVETLGSASVICADKTGTLTQNKMTLMQVYDTKEGVLEQVSNQNGEHIKEILRLATLCCNGTLQVEKNEILQVGDPTETCIVYATYQNGESKDFLNQKYERVGEIPFDSERKLMSTINYINGKYTVITKGGFEMLAKCCIDGNIEEGQRIVEQMSKKALRVLGVATKTLTDGFDMHDIQPENVEKDLTLIGVLGMMDPPRNEVKEAVAICKKAGVRPIMITGDHVMTAKAIAAELGILEEGKIAITGDVLKKFADKTLREKIEQIAVYARVTPEDKIRIVKAWNEAGHVVAMTGDGVNDAPALKAADIGCAMGITGTDVSKEAADMILTDDNFATIVSAIRAGRGIFSNIRKSVCYLLGTNIGEVLTVFIGMLIWHKSPLISMQLLWINLVTDSLPAIALGMEKADEDLMKQKPLKQSEGFFSKSLKMMLALQGTMFCALSLIGFSIAYAVTGDLVAARTETFMILSMVQIVQAFNMRSHKSLFRVGWFTNSALNKAALISFLLIAVVLFVPPITFLFELKRLTIMLYMVGMLLIMVPLVVTEGLKAFHLLQY